jgi:dolichol-phosphate mannosyltransferase
MVISIIIPCYNEQANITKMEDELLPVVEKLATSYPLELIFVDDGSSDRTFQVLKDTFEGNRINGVDFKFERHIKNRGLGAALRTGFQAANGNLVVTTDSDGTYQFSKIPDLLSKLGERIDIVTASPYHPQGKVVGVPGYRLLLSRGSSFIYRVLVVWNIHTYTSLFRVYRREVVDNVNFQSDGFLGGTELMVKAMLMGYRVAEYPAVLYRRAYGVSKAKIAQTIMAHLRFQGRVLLHRIHLLPLYKSDVDDGGDTWGNSRLLGIRGNQK